MKELKNKESNLEKKTRKSKSEKGILTLDFIFSILAVYAIGMVFTLLSVTLMFASIVQYMAFSSARAHISGHISESQQQQAGALKLQELMGGYLGRLIKTTDEGWFKIESTGTANTVFDLPDSSSQKAYGIQIRYTSNLLKNVRLPLLGSPGDGAEEGFGAANIYGFLYREPSTEECLGFNRARWTVLKERFPNITLMPNFSDDKNFGEEADNGC